MGSTPTLATFGELTLHISPVTAGSWSSGNEGLVVVVVGEASVTGGGAMAIVVDPYNHLKNWSNSSSSFCKWFGVTCDSNIERVTILSLPEMGFEGTLPSQIENLSFLEKLELQSNNVHGGLPKELLQLHKLEILNLSYNTFSGDIPTWIGSLFMLQPLYLGNNSFGGPTPQSIYNLSKLETLDMMSNSINGSIPLDIGRL
ncbi:LRR receptor kinase SERL2-like [Prosopis cineraria]|uniref:LRR receptor kinase SERL2-like n=1 Tax=Prosopis cineraria TaxID=364024 RepID=UPI0024104E58|nr:LRR receptor kinase SERL2-like [Prosopis cineraria]